MVHVDVNSSGWGFDPQSLMKFVMATRLDLLAERTFDRRTNTWIQLGRSRDNRTSMEVKMGYAKKSLAKMLSQKGEVRSRTQVIEFEHRLLAFSVRERKTDVDVVTGVGWLASFWDELGENPPWYGERVDKALEIVTRHRNVPLIAGLARWHPDLCEAGPHNSAEALILGETLLALIGLSGNPVALVDGYQPHVERTIRALVSVATRPPGGGATPAIQLAAQFGDRALPIVKEHLECSGVGFRAMRIVTRMLRLARTGPPPWWDPVEPHVRAACALLEAMSSRDDLPDPYPGRSFFVEAVREAALCCQVLKLSSWLSKAEALLRDRVSATERPHRERVYAAYCLRELGFTSRLELPADHRSDEVWSFAERLLGMTRPNQSIESLLIDRGDDGPFFGWMAASNVYPLTEMQIVGRHVTAAGSAVHCIPESVRRSTAMLIGYGLLSPHGTNRRHACEALREAGVGPEAVQVTVNVLNDAESPRWLQEIAAFILGCLECTDACEPLAKVAIDRGRHPTVRHAALFALGDLRTRTNAAIDAAFDAMAEAPPDIAVQRAATYVLAVLRPNAVADKGVPGDAYRFDEQRAKLAALKTEQGQDPAIKAIADWGVESINRYTFRTDPKQRHDSEIWGLRRLRR